MTRKNLGTAFEKNQHWRTSAKDVDLLDQYCFEVARYQVLDAYTCAMLAQKAKAGDADARTDLIHANLRLVIPLAREAASSFLAGREVLDLIQIGNMALMGCINGYRWYEGGVAFVRWAMGAVRFAYRTEALRDGRIVPTAYLFDAGDLPLPSHVSHAPHPDTDEDADAEARYDQLLATARCILTANEYFVLTRLGGLEPGEGTWTHREVAKALGLHRNTPSAIRKRAAAKLRPYFAAYLSASSAAVLSSGASPGAGKQTPAATLLVGTTAQAAGSKTTTTANQAIPTNPAQALLTAAPELQPSDSPSRTARRRADGGPLPLSMRKSSAQRGRESNQTEKKTA